MSKSLGKLERIDLHKIWESEAGGFTPWLTKEQNLKLLGATLGMELELEGAEKHVGPFYADILCRDMDDNSQVLIENQLYKTDHKHLGQLLTYAPGLNAATIIWVAAKFVEEHRAALDWLNNITDREYRFFGLEIELWKIGDSPVAPKFNIVSKPNDWTQSIKHKAQQIAETPTQTLQIEFWQALADHFQKTGCKIKPRTPAPRSWMIFGIGCYGFHMIALMYVQKNRLGVGIEVLHKNSEIHFKLLYSQKEEVEKALGSELEWAQKSGSASKMRIVHFRDADLSDKSRWPEYLEWIRTNLETVDRVFRKRVKALSVKK